MNDLAQGTPEPSQLLRVEQGAGHLDIMVRQTRIHHMTLSISADAKANMLMIAASVVLTLAARETEGGNHIPALILTVFSLASVCLAILAAMPKLGLGRKSAPSRNLLFFAHFTTLSYEQYLREMDEVMSSPAKTYEMQLREIYEIGQYLKQHKFRYVNAGYMVFLIGLFTAGSTWVVQAVM